MRSRVESDEKVLVFLTPPPSTAHRRVSDCPYPSLSLTIPGFPYATNKTDRASARTVRGTQDNLPWAGPTAVEATFVLSFWYPQHPNPANFRTEQLFSSFPCFLATRSSPLP